jgi:hypothetical protein
LVDSGRKDILGFSQAADYRGKNMIDSFFSAGRWMERFKLIILLILSVSALLIFHGCGGGGGGGSSGSPGEGDTSGSINLAWEASSDSAVVGHLVHYGTRPGTYEYSADAGSTPGPSTTVSYPLGNLSKGQTYYIAVTAYDRYRNESDFSNEVSGLAK